jgi:hypothetical protein
MFVADFNFKFLSTNTIWLGPIVIVFRGDFAVADNSLYLIDDR